MNNYIGRHLIGICGSLRGLATFSTAPSTTLILKVGSVLRVKRTFTESDVVDYARVSGDANRVHLDDEFARAISPRFRGRVVHVLVHHFTTVSFSPISPEQYMFHRRFSSNRRFTSERRLLPKWRR